MKISSFFIFAVFLGFLLSCAAYHTDSTMNVPPGDPGGTSAGAAAAAREYPSGLDRLEVPAEPRNRSGDRPPPGGHQRPSVTPPASPGSIVAIDKDGNTSVLTPNRSGAYTGFDQNGNGVMITPLRPGGSHGMDNLGNTWSLPPAR